MLSKRGGRATSFLRAFWSKQRRGTMEPCWPALGDMWSLLQTSTCQPNTKTAHSFDFSASHFPKLAEVSFCFKTSACGYREGYKHDKKEHPPFLPRMQPEPKVVSNFPEELVCVLCKLLMVNAAIVPCCGYSFCDNCEFPLSLSVKQCQGRRFCLIKTCLFRHQDHSVGVRATHLCHLPADCFPR